MNIKLKIAEKVDQTALRNLFQLYLHDLSAYTVNLDVNDDGIFE